MKKSCTICNYVSDRTLFKLTALENDIGQQSRLLNAVIDQWRYNGQIIGREIPLYLTEEDGEQGFAMRVICPEQDSLYPKTIINL